MSTLSSELGKRIATGVIGGALLLWLIIFGGWPGVTLLTVVLSLAMIWEFSTMALSLGDRAEKRLAMLCVTWFIALINFLSPKTEYESLIFSFFGLFLYFLFTATRHTPEEYLAHFRELVFSFFGLIYLAYLPLYLPRIHESSNGVHWTLIFLFVNWASDTGGYFVGRKYGTRKLFPQISPNKTIEGSAGGLAAAFLVVLLYKLIFFRSMSWIGVVMIPILVGSVSQLGDLCESFIKRAFDKKDSGTLLPGHGGFLDRFDGFVFSLPVMYAAVRIFG